MKNYSVLVTVPVVLHGQYCYRVYAYAENEAEARLEAVKNLQSYLCEEEFLGFVPDGEDMDLSKAEVQACTPWRYHGFERVWCDNDEQGVLVEGQIVELLDGYGQQCPVCMVGYVPTDFPPPGEKRYRVRLSEALTCTVTEETLYEYESTVEELARAIKE